MTEHVRHPEAAAAEEADGKVQVEDLLTRTFDDLRDELLSTLAFVLGNREDARDAAQEAFLKCWNARHQLPEVINLRGWIFRVGFNTAKDIQRSAWHRRVKPMRAEQYTMTSKDASPIQNAEAHESVERLRLAILDLRQEEKEVFLLRQNGDLTYDQIAELHGCPVGTVKTRMRTALEKLRKTLTTTT